MARTLRPIAPGQTFGRLTVISAPYYRLDKHGHGIMYCAMRCACGRELEVRKNNILRGNSQSCGCLRSEMLMDIHWKHGESKKGSSKLYVMWQGMRKRCVNPREPRYKHYGGRGIAVCPEWSDSYIAFRDWALAAGYAPGLSLDRVNVDGPYAPANCRFVPLEAQQGNTQRTAWLTYAGETKSVAAWSRDARCVVGAQTLAYRRRAGWPTRDALTVPASFAPHIHSC